MISGGHLLLRWMFGLQCVPASQLCFHASTSSSSAPTPAATRRAADCRNILPFPAPAPHHRLPPAPGRPGRQPQNAACLFLGHARSLSPNAHLPRRTVDIGPALTATTSQSAGSICRTCEPDCLKRASVAGSNSLRVCSHESKVYPVRTCANLRSHSLPASLHDPANLSATLSRGNRQFLAL